MEHMMEKLCHQGFPGCIGVSVIGDTVEVPIKVRGIGRHPVVLLALRELDYSELNTGSGRFLGYGYCVSGSSTHSLDCGRGGDG
ncbi:hypothetical protein ES703_96670 [subsurface metagenome]